MRTLLVTGSEGLVGTALRRALAARGFAIARFDLCGNGADAGDIRDCEALRRRLTGCVGVISLAAVSRVVWGERDPDADAPASPMIAADAVLDRRAP